MKEHLFFDFGAVLLPIDEKRTQKAFEALGAAPTLQEQKVVFQDYECGKIDSPSFIEALKPHFFRRPFSGDVAAAWNAMIYTPIPAEVISFLQKLKRKGHKLYLLSNTNELHIQKIVELSGPFDYAQFIKCFNRVYYSHEVGKRKPNTDFYKAVLKAEKLKAEDCYFTDDRAENVEAAAALGIEAVLFHPEEDSILDLGKAR